MGQTWVRHCPITYKYLFQGCALRKIEGSPVLWTCEIQGAQHIISIEKSNILWSPRSKIRCQGLPDTASPHSPVFALDLTDANINFACSFVCKRQRISIIKEWSQFQVVMFSKIHFRVGVWGKSLLCWGMGVFFRNKTKYYTAC